MFFLYSNYQKIKNLEVIKRTVVPKSKQKSPFYKNFIVMCMWKVFWELPSNSPP